MRWTSGVKFAPIGLPALRGSFWFFVFLGLLADGRAQTLPPAEVARVYAQAAEAARESRRSGCGTPLTAAPDARKAPCVRSVVKAPCKKAPP